MSVAKRIAVFIIVGIVGIQSAPANVSESQNNNIIQEKDKQYDLRGFDTIYDQRQNGSVNYRFNMNGVTVVMTPSGDIMQGVPLLTPQLTDDEYEDLLDEFLGFITQKPSQATKPNSPTTVKPIESTGSALNGTINVSQVQPNPSSSNVKSEATKRKFKVPGFLRAFAQHKPSQTVED